EPGRHLCGSTFLPAWMDSGRLSPVHGLRPGDLREAFGLLAGAVVCRSDSHVLADFCRRARLRRPAASRPRAGLPGRQPGPVCRGVFDRPLQIGILAPPAAIWASQGTGFHELISAKWFRQGSAKRGGSANHLRNLQFDVTHRKMSTYDNEKRGSAKSWG